MIFKTFDSDIDKISAKWGIFGKSFNEIGTAITGRISDINKGFQATDDILGAFKDTDSIWKRLYPSKETIQSKMIDVDALYPKIDDSVAQKILNDLTQQQKLIDTTKGSWNDYFKEFQEGDKWQIEFVQNTDLQKASINDVKKSYEGARQAALAHNAALEQQTLSAKAGQVALKGLAIAGNMLVMWAITKVIEVTIKGIDNLAHSAEHCKERVDELMSSYKSALDSANSNAKKVEDLAEKYEKLSDGVDNLGRNVKLTNDEYEEYNSLVNDIADMFPTLVQGYTDEGNAIISLKGNVEQLRDAYKEAQQEAYNLLIASGKDTNGNDIITNWKNTQNTGFWANLFDFGSDDVGGGISISNAVKQLKAIQKMTYEEYQKLQNTENTASLSETEKDILYGSYLYKALDISATSSKEDFESAKKQAKVLVQTYNAEIESALDNVKSLANAYLMTNSTYKNLDNEEVKNAASIIVNSLDANIASQFEDITDVGEYVNNILEVISTNENGVQDALVGLFTTDLSELSAENAKFIVDQYINSIAEVLDEDPVELKVRLKFEDYDTIAENYQNVLHEAAKKASGVTDGEIINGRGKADEYHEIYKKIDDFGKKYAINTQDEIAAFDKAIDEAEGDIEKAFQIYLNDKAEREQLIITKESLDSVKTYRDELGKLYESLALLRSGEASPTDLYSLIEEFPELSKYVEDLKQGLDLEPSEAVNYVEALQGQIRNLIDIRFDSLKEKFGDIVGEDVLRSLAKYSVKTEAVNSAFDATAEAINNTSEAFQTLSESVKYYNEHGYITLDMLENIVKMEPKKLAMLMEENELIKENTDAYKQYLKLQLQSYKYDITEEAQKEHKRLEEAYRNGEISWAERQAGWADTTEAWRIKYNAVTDTWDAIESGEYLPGSSEASSTESVLDWIEIKIKSITEEIEKLKEVADDPFASWDERSSNLKTALDRMKALREDYTKAAQIYLDKANSIGLDSSYVGKIQSGAWDIDDVPEDITQDTYELIQEYQTWWDKYQEMLNSERDATLEINDLTRNSFDQIISRFDAELSHFENVANMIEAKLSNAEAKGFMATQQYYATLYDVELAKKAELENKLVELNNALNETDFKTDTETWSELANNIEEVEISIQESTNAMQEFNNEIRQIDWDLFDFARDQESKFMNEADFMIDLLDSAKMFSEAGEITAEGMATMGLHAANYNAYLEQSISYAEELAKRQAEIETGSTDRAVIDRYNELLELQQESILSAESEKDAMIDLVSEGIELQKEAFQGLIDEYTEALDIQKDLYDYQKKNSEQTKKIANIQKQLAAYQGDQSEEARAKVQQLKVQLDEEQSNLESDQYDRYISDQKEILNTIYEDYETTLDIYLDNATRVISDSINMANKNATTIGKTLTKATNEVGYDVKNVWIDERGLLSVNFSGIKSNIQAGTNILHDIKESNDRLIAAQKSAISESLGDLSSTDGVLNQTLTSIRDIVSEINGKISGEGGGSSSSSGTEGGGGNTPSGNNEKVPNGNGGNFTAGATLKKVTGTWYAASDGTGNSGSVTTAGATSWKIDKINEGSKYPYHIIGYKNGKFAGSGWVKKSQISAYKTGARRIDEDQNAWTQENGTEYIIRPSDGAILTPLYKGDSVLNAEATKNLWNMANNPMQFIKDNMSTSIPNAPSNGNSNIENNIQMTITLPGVTNYQEFVSRLQSDKKFEKMIVDVTSSALTGSNSLSKYRHKF